MTTTIPSLPPSNPVSETPVQSEHPQCVDQTPSADAVNDGNGNNGNGMPTPNMSVFGDLFSHVPEHADDTLDEACDNEHIRENDGDDLDVDMQDDAMWQDRDE